MLLASQRARLTIVLVGARNPQNIGAAARAMQDFGFPDLRIVNSFTPPLEAARLEATSAVGAAAVLAAARQFPDLPSAIADCTLVAGTTAIGARELDRPVTTLQATAPDLLHALGPPDSRVALLFGSEKTGLTNDQLSHCQLLLTIPLFDPAALAAGTRHLSMNLGQSVAVCLYELSRQGFEHTRPLPAPAPGLPTGEDRERLTRLLVALMQTSGYARRFPANAREIVVRKLAHRLAATAGEAQTWMGLLKMLGKPSPPQPPAEPAESP